MGERDLLDSMKWEKRQGKTEKIEPSLQFFSEKK